MTLRNIISYTVYSDFVSEKFIANRIFLPFSQSAVNLSSLLTGDINDL